MSIYGFGENEHATFKHDMNFMRYGMYSRDQAPMVSADTMGKLRYQNQPFLEGVGTCAVSQAPCCCCSHKEQDTGLPGAVWAGAGEPKLHVDGFAICSHSATCTASTPSTCV